MKAPISTERINLLAQKWQEARITEEELLEFNAWYTSFDEVLEVDNGERREQTETRLYESIVNKAQIGSRHRITLWTRIAAAAVLIIAVGTGLYLFQASKSRLKEAQLKMAAAYQIKPGGNVASLILGNGKTVPLSTAKNGIAFNATGLTYDDGTAVQPDAIMDLKDDLTVITPRGGSYQIALPDGTRVWLNAASRLTYKNPSKHKAKTRTLELSGEGYFEVAKNKTFPFVVLSGGQRVEVLGTHFNISSYPDEPVVKTTLLEGSVRVEPVGYTTGSHILKPGEQSLFKGHSIQVKQTDTEEVIAWKNGFFRFNEESLTSVMNKISRWYNVDLIYEGGVKKYEHIALGGFVSRHKDLGTVLKVIEQTDQVHFEVKEKKVRIIL
ncbi:FecR family protein [Pedobacter nyackensis]|uniref:FecR family protein n=1 Tax=Pedobacter nyackensis TaxID=475255 RepID=UPI0029300543|nr:FecR domain-containing protein [Pedobacter nyackensis]